VKTNGRSEEEMEAKTTQAWLEHQRGKRRPGTPEEIWCRAKHMGLNSCGTDGCAKAMEE